MFSFLLLIIWILISLLWYLSYLILNYYETDWDQLVLIAFYGVLLFLTAVILVLRNEYLRWRPQNVISIKIWEILLNQRREWYHVYKDIETKVILLSIAINLGLICFASTLVYFPFLQITVADKLVVVIINLIPIIVFFDGFSHSHGFE